MKGRTTVVLLLVLCTLIVAGSSFCYAEQKSYVSLDPISAMDDLNGVRRSVNFLLEKRETGLHLTEVKEEVHENGTDQYLLYVEDEEGNKIENVEVLILGRGGHVMDFLCTTVVPLGADPYTMIDSISAKVMEALLISLGVEKEDVVPMITAGTRGNMYAEKLVRRSHFVAIYMRSGNRELNGAKCTVNVVHVDAFAPQFYR